MNFRKVTAIFPDVLLEKVEKRLAEMGVPGITLTKVKGYGEYCDYYKKDWMSTHTRLEIFTQAEHAEAIANSIMEAAHMGKLSEGIVAVVPVEKLMHIRDWRSS